MSMLVTRFDWRDASALPGTRPRVRATGRSPGVRRTRTAFCLALFCLSGLVAAAFPEADGPAPDEIARRFRLGPFFEYRATRDGGRFWAVRPFYAQRSDPAADTRATDIAWPLATFHRDREQAWWRCLMAYGTDQDARCDASAWKAAIFPLYFQGRSRAGEDYWALFPIYGRLPHLLLMENIEFALFPFYLDYDINSVNRRYYLWPFYSRVADDDGTRTSLFPFYGSARRANALSRYAFWPFWTSAVYEGARNPGTSWMLFPLAGSVNREKEQQRLVLPPFFSHARTDAIERWRLPWPFYETVTTATSRRRSYWPFYSDFSSEADQRWSAGWMLFQSLSLQLRDGRKTSDRLFPFYAQERIYRADASGVEREVERYTRVWPLYTSEFREGVARLRTLELNPIRHSAAIERNWAPFWTFYTRDERDGTVTHDALWGIIRFTRPVSKHQPQGEAP